MSPDFEKYGVEEVPEDTKKASSDLEETARICPSCGAKIESDEYTNIRKCPNCGTLPYERP